MKRFQCHSAQKSFLGGGGGDIAIIATSSRSRSLIRDLRLTLDLDPSLTTCEHMSCMGYLAFMKKWGCNPNTIRTWIRKAGKTLSNLGSMHVDLDCLSVTLSEIPQTTNEVCIRIHLFYI